jgi:hypothetical protein
VSALEQIDVDRLERQSEQAEQQLHAVCVAGQRMTVELDGLGHEPQFGLARADRERPRFAMRHCSQ